MAILGLGALVVVWGLVLCWFDCKERRLPNWLTISGGAVALVFRLGYGGVPFFLDGFAASMVAGLFLLIPFLMHGAGGGDVKMMAAAGAVVGWSAVLYLLWFASLVGIFLGIGMIVFGKLDASRVKHCLRCVFDWRYDRKAGREALPPKDSEKVRMPFSIPILVGLLAAMLFS